MYMAYVVMEERYKVCFLTDSHTKKIGNCRSQALLQGPPSHQTLEENPPQFVWCKQDGLRNGILTRNMQNDDS